MGSLGMTWDDLGHLGSLRLAWNLLGPLVCTWGHMDSPGFTLIHFDSFLVHKGSLAFT